MKQPNHVPQGRSNKAVTDWSLDGKAVYEFQGLSLVCRRLLSNPHKERTFPPLALMRCSSGQVPVLVDLGHGMLSLIVPSDSTQKGKLMSQEIVIRSLERPGHFGSAYARIPNADQIRVASVSRNHRRVLWQCSSLDRKSESIWISNIDGSGVRELGRIKITTLGEAGESLHFGDIHWGSWTKRLCYIFKGKLYEFKVD